MSFMPSILAGFAKAFPEVHILLDSQPSTKLIAANRASELDFSQVNIVDNSVAYEITAFGAGGLKKHWM